MKVGGLLQPLQSFEMCRSIVEGFQGLGVDSVWSPDHLLGLVHPDLWPEVPASEALSDPDSWLDPFCVMSAIGGSTSVPMGTCVTDSARRRGADLARTALTLNQICGGGFILGIGTGEAESVLPFGYDFDRPVGNLEQALIEIRALFDTGRMPGGVGRTGLSSERLPGRPEVWVAANGLRTLRLTGRYGDGWLPTTPTAELYAEQWEQVRAAAEHASRPAPVAGLCALTIFGPSRDDVAAQIAATPLSKLLMLFQPASVWHRYGLEHPAGEQTRGWIDTVPHALDPDLIRDAIQQVPLEMMEERVFFGDAEEIAARLKPFSDVGLEHVVVCDITALVYPPDQAASHMQQLKVLCDLLHGAA